MPSATTVWVQKAIDQYTTGASILITSSALGEGITITWDYSTDEVTSDSQTLSRMAIAITNKVVEDEVILNARGFEIDTIGHFDIRITGANDPVLSEQILMLVDNPNARH